MKKIPTVLVRDPEDRAHVLLEVTPGCEWVLAGEGVATRKYDGTCVMLDIARTWWARREVKPGKREPEGWLEEDVDDVTGKRVGWEPVDRSPFARFHDEAVRDAQEALAPGTYELCGPKINANPEHYPAHVVVAHETATPVPLPQPLTVVVIAQAVVDLSARYGFEGLVWHHPDGRMAKLKARDLSATGEIDRLVPTPVP